MVGSQINLSPYKDEIVDLFNQKETSKAICTQLAHRYSISIPHKYTYPAPVVGFGGIAVVVHYQIGSIRLYQIISF